MEADKIYLGEVFTYEFSFKQKDVELFAKATGDYNPIHLDSEYASKTMFKTPIIHGFLGGSIFSRVFGTIWPGEGTIYLKQDLKFLSPMRADHNYLAKFEVNEVFPEKNRALINTSVFDEDRICIAGQAVIIHPTKL